MVKLGPPTPDEGLPAPLPPPPKFFLNNSNNNNNNNNNNNKIDSYATGTEVGNFCLVSYKCDPCQSLAAFKLGGGGVGERERGIYKMNSYFLWVCTFSDSVLWHLWTIVHHIKEFAVTVL